jgi:hypothetical protein
LPPTTARVGEGVRVSSTGEKKRRMDALGWLIVVLVLIALAVVAFIVVQRRRRAGGVIATRGKP